MKISGKNTFAGLRIDNPDRFQYRMRSKIIITLTLKNQTFLAILHFLIHLFRNENKILGTN